MPPEEFGTINIDTIYKRNARKANDQDEKPGHSRTCDSANIVLLGQTFENLIECVPVSASAFEDYWGRSLSI